ETEVHVDVVLADALPAARAVVAGEDAAVVLLPQPIGRGRARSDEMWIVAPLGLGVGQVVVEHAAVAAAPALAAVARLELACRRHADIEVVPVARVDDDRVDAGD